MRLRPVALLAAFVVLVTLGLIACAYGLLMRRYRKAGL